MDENNLKQRRSIRDIPLSGKPTIYKKTNNKDINLRKISDDRERDSEYNEPRKRTHVISGDNRNYCGPKFRLRNIYLFLLIIAIPLIIFIYSKVSEGAILNISLKKSNFKANDLEFILIDENQSVIDFGLNYKIITLDEEHSVTVSAQKEELVRQKASGLITVYNEFSQNDQNWIQNTRFRAPNGNIYRTPVAITVPGYKTVDGEKEPGQIKIEVIADDFGESFNLSAGTKFSIPGFDGQESAKYYYAVAETDFSNGFDGVKKIISEDDLLTSKINLETVIKNRLNEKIEKQIPSNLIALHNESSFKFGNIVQTNVDSENVSLMQNGSLDLVVFEKTDLYHQFGLNHIPDYTAGDKVVFQNEDEITTNLVVDDNDNMSVLLNGEIIVEWQIDEDDIIEKLIGRKVTELKEIMTNKEVVSITAEIAPFWRNTFPDKKSRIQINKVN